MGFFQAKLELFLDSPFDDKPVWSQVINGTQVNGIPVHPPYVADGWGWNQRWGGWNISKTEAQAPKGRYLVFSAFTPTDFYEMVVYGKQQGPPPPSPPPAPPPPLPLMGPFLGINSFVTEPLARQVRGFLAHAICTIVATFIVHCTCACGVCARACV